MRAKPGRAGKRAWPIMTGRGEIPSAVAAAGTTVRRGCHGSRSCGSLDSPGSGFSGKDGGLAAGDLRPAEAGDPPGAGFEGGSGYRSGGMVRSGAGLNG
jgi:hypothetical protein